LISHIVCVGSMWVPCVALPSGRGSSVGPSPLCGSPVWVPCAGPLWVPGVGPLCVGPLCGSPVWVPRRAASMWHVASTRVMSPARSHAPALIWLVDKMISIPPRDTSPHQHIYSRHTVCPMKFPFMQASTAFCLDASSSPGAAGADPKAATVLFILLIIYTRHIFCPLIYPPQ